MKITSVEPFILNALVSHGPAASDRGSDQVQHSRKHDLPGSIITPMQEHFAKVNGNGRSVEEMYREFAKPVPLVRLGHSWEIAELAAFLASPRSGFCIGAQFTADGGLLAGLRIF